MIPRGGSITLPPRQELTVIDGSTVYTFYIAPGPQGGKLLSIQSVAWEPADGTKPWRVPLHPWMAGLGPNRINPKVTFAGDLRNRPSMVYAKANADASNPNFLTAPPLLTALGTNVTTSYFNTPQAQLAYGGAMYGGVEYMGAVSSTTSITVIVRNFNGKAYFGAGQFIYSLDASYNFSTVHDFGAGANIFDMEVFKNEMIIALGKTTKIYKMDTSESFTQASDNTFAIALGLVDDKLWRADENGNLVSNCITTPLTLANWVPTGTNAYAVGDSTYDVIDIIDYGGTPWVRKADGVYAADGNTVFHNQTPQLKDYPNTDRAYNMFRGWGYLWVPSIAGMLRCTYGESVVVGPELSNRPDFHFNIRGGVEWNGDILLTCNDADNVAQTFICKMMKDTHSLTETPYIYHEYADIGVQTSNFITVFTVPTNPTGIVGSGGGIQYFKLGRGSGIAVDDSNYAYGTSYTIESGDFMATDDRAIEITLTGVKIVGKQPANSTLTAQYDLDRTGVWKQMLSNEAAGGQTNIGNKNFFTKTLYAPPETVGHSCNIKILGTITSGHTGTDRPELYEAWAFGEAHPETTDVLTIGLLTDPAVRVRGLRHEGQFETNAADLLHSWCDHQRTVIFQLPGYDELQTCWGTFVDYEDSSVDIRRSGQQEQLLSVCKVVLRRIDFQGVL